MAGWGAGSSVSRRAAAGARAPALYRHVGPARRRVRTRTQALELDVLEGAFDAMACEIEERLACSQGLEVRYPFCNHKIIQPRVLHTATAEGARAYREANSPARAGGSSARAGVARAGQGGLHGRVPAPAGSPDGADPARRPSHVGSTGSASGAANGALRRRTATRRRRGDASGGCGRSSAVMPSCKPAPRRDELIPPRYGRRIGSATRRQEARVHEAGSENLWSRQATDGKQRRLGDGRRGQHDASF